MKKNNRLFTGIGVFIVAFTFGVQVFAGPPKSAQQKLEQYKSLDQKISQEIKQKFFNQSQNISEQQKFAVSSPNMIDLGEGLIKKEDLKYWHFKGPEDQLTVDTPAGKVSYALQGINLSKVKNNLKLNTNFSKIAPVIVSVTDGGTNYYHEAIVDYKWENHKELIGQYKSDDDNNGRKDDIHGWNWIGRTNGDSLEITRLSFACQAGQEVKNNGILLDEQACQTIVSEHKTERESCYEDMAWYKLYFWGLYAIDKVHNLGLKQLVEQSNADISAARAQGKNVQAIEEALRIKLIDKLSPLLDEAKSDAFSLYEHLLPYKKDVIAGQVDQSEYSDRAVLDDIVFRLIRYNHHFWEDLSRNAGKDCVYQYGPSHVDKKVEGYIESQPEAIYGDALAVGSRMSHGTHVASTIIDVVKEALGQEASQKALKIMTNRVTPDGDERDVDVSNATLYATSQGAHIINMSFGKSHSGQKELVDRAFKLAEDKGVLLNVSAGNSRKEVTLENNFPSPVSIDGHRFNNILMVGASNFANERLNPEHADKYHQSLALSAYGQIAVYFSNYSQKHVDLFAPGSFIYAADSHQFLDRDSYDYKQGTSMASPVVSGVAALVLTQFPNLRNKADVLRTILMNSVRRYDDEISLGGVNMNFAQASVSGGVIDAYDALCAADQWSKANNGPRIEGCE